MTEVEQLEEQKDSFKEAIELRDCALRLHENADFKKLILNKFMLEECARYVQVSADPALKPENRADALAIAQAAGHLKRYLSIVVQMGNHAENSMVRLDEAIDDVRNEGGDE